MDLQLQSHTAVVTGGAGGIGLATCRAFAAEESAVAIWDLAANIADMIIFLSSSRALK